MSTQASWLPSNPLTLTPTLAASNWQETKRAQNVTICCENYRQMKNFFPPLTAKTKTNSLWDETQQ